MFGVWRWHIYAYIEMATKIMFTTITVFCVNGNVEYCQRVARKVMGIVVERVRVGYLSNTMFFFGKFLHFVYVHTMCFKFTLIHFNFLCTCILITNVDKSVTTLMKGYFHILTI